jgi:hypothetical protein
MQKEFQGEFVGGAMDGKSMSLLLPEGADHVRVAEFDSRAPLTRPAVVWRRYDIVVSFETTTLPYRFVRTEDITLEAP